MIRMLSWLLLAVVAFDAQTWAYDVFNSAYLYELGFYGLYPTTSFKSSELTPPRLNFPQWDEQKCGSGYYLIAPKGKIVADPGPTILDARGELVWADYSYGVVFNFQIQTYEGEQYLTFWASPDGSSHGYGRGTYYMLDSSYQLFRKFEAAGQGLRGDLHEFRLTARGTALLTVYNPVPADLTPVGGPEQGWALDCLFQEIDVDTGELVFEWSAIEHVAPRDAVRYFAGEDDGTTPDTAFDFFHLNSVDLGRDGNYILSARHTSSILCVSPTGDILWTLGGGGGGGGSAANSFHDLSGGRATDFMYQHHAQIISSSSSSSSDVENATTKTTTMLLSIFDNAASERAGPASRHAHSRGLLVRLDTANMTATLVRAYHDADRHPGRAAASQGSMQVLGDRVVLGYGWLPFITEFARDDDDDDDDSGEGKQEEGWEEEEEEEGEEEGAAPPPVLCAVELAPWVAARWGLVNTYRASRAAAWVGAPRAPPAIALRARDGRAFVSWNGATEVARWVLQGADWDDLRAAAAADTDTDGDGDGDGDGFVDLGVAVDKVSFETVLAVSDDMPRYVRAAALDARGAVLARTQVVDRRVGNAAASAADWVRDALVWAAAALLLLVAAAVAVRRCGRGRALLLGGGGGGSARWRDWAVRAVAVCRGRAAVGGGGGGAGTYGRSYPWVGWWRDWGGAKEHELRALYHD